MDKLHSCYINKKKINKKIRARRTDKNKFNTLTNIRNMEYLNIPKMG